MVEVPAIQSVGPRVQIGSTIGRAQRLLICMLCAAGLAAVVLSQLKVYSPDWERDIPHPMIAQGTLVTACLIGVLTFGWAVHRKRSAAVPSFIYALCHGLKALPGGAAVPAARNGLRICHLCTLADSRDCAGGGQSRASADARAH